LEAIDVVAATPLLDARLLCEPTTGTNGIVDAVFVALGRLDVARDATTDVRSATLRRLAIPGATLTEDVLFDAVPIGTLLNAGIGGSNVGRLPRCRVGFGPLMTAAVLAPLGAREVLVEAIVDCEVFRALATVGVLVTRGAIVEGRAAIGAREPWAPALGAILEVDGDGSSTETSPVLLTTGVLEGRSLDWAALDGGGAVLDTVERMVFMTLAAPDRRRPNRPDGATLTGAINRLLAALPPVLILPFELRRGLAAFFKVASFSLTIAVGIMTFSIFAKSAPSTRRRFGGGGTCTLSLGSSRQMTRLLAPVRGW
jgi:hypothetical protein